MSYNTGGINLKLTANTQQALESLRKFNNATEVSVGNVKDLDKSTTKNLNKNLRDTNNEANALSKTFGKLETVVKRAFGIAIVSQTTRKALKEILDYTENYNMFSVAMGNQLITEAMTFQRDITEALGSSQSDTMRMQGFYMALSESLGIVGDKAYILSENLTKVAYDLASLYNFNPNEMYSKLQSGLVGQTKPLRSVGIDVTQQTLQPYLAELGIDTMVKNLTQAEKVLLRYIAIIKQSSIAHGDMALTLDNPANQIRILTAQIRELYRWIGATFIGLLSRVLPYINGFVMAIVSVVKTIAKLFGFNVEQYGDIGRKEMLGLDGMLEDDMFEPAEVGSDNVANNLGKANQNAKELRKQLAGFDEINNLTSNDRTNIPSGAVGGVGGVGIGQGKHLDTLLNALKGYDNLMGDVQSKAHDIRDAIMDWLGFTQDAVNDTWKLKDGYTNFEKIVDALKFMSVWKLSSSLLKLLTGKGLFATLFGGKAGAGIVGGTTAGKGLVASVFGTNSTLGITKLFDETGELSGLAYHNGFWGKVASLSDTVGIWLMDKFPKLFGGLKGFEDIGNFSKITGILTPILHTIDLVSNSEFFRKGLGAIFNISWQTISTVGGGVIDVIKGLSVSIDNVLSPLGLFSSDLGMVATGVGLLATGNPLGALVLGFEGLTLAVRGFGWLMSDAVDEVDLFHELSSQTKAKVEPFIESVNELEASIQLIDYGNLVITDDIVTDIKGKVETISQTLINELDMDKNDALNKLNPIKNLYTEEEFAEVLTKVEGFYDDQKTKVSFGEDRINEIVSTARTQGRELQEHELAEIDRITKDMLDTGIRHLSENETEALVIKERLKQNRERLTVEEAQNILQQSKELKEKSIQDAEDQYNGVLTAAVLLKEAGVINEEEYDAMVQNAEEAKTEQINKATETYEQIKEETRIGMGNLANTIDFESGQIKTKWDMFMSGLYEITAGWGASITSWLNGIRAHFNLVKIDAEAMANRQYQWYQPQPYNTNQTYGYPRGYANGGFVSSGEIFMANENGKAEMIGRFGRTTAVANNEQIVAGISQGVYNAVVQANKGGNQPINITLPVNVGGTRVGTELIRYLRNTQEETGEYILAFD